MWIALFLATALAPTINKPGLALGMGLQQPPPSALKACCDESTEESSQRSLESTTQATCNASTDATTEAHEGRTERSRRRLTAFLQHQMDAVAQDVAIGRGEHLDCVMGLLEVPSEHRASAARTFQASFAKVFDVPGVTHPQVAARLVALRDSQTAW